MDFNTPFAINPTNIIHDVVRRMAAVNPGSFAEVNPVRCNLMQALGRPILDVPVRVSNQNGTYVIEVALPGWTTKEHVELSLAEENCLAIKITCPEQEDKPEYLVQEFAPHNLTRYVRLPEKIAADSISANCEGNLLKILVQKTSPKRDIPIEVS